jgi:hypothetical protein
MKKTKKASEGELFIGEYLKFKNIAFESRIKFNNLKHDDDFQYREADFFLKKYGVYIEFNGRWNNTKEDRVRYRVKKEVFRKNNLPCIYLYPENLGIIDFVFTKRLIAELQNKSLTKQLRKFQLKRFMDDRARLFIWFFLGVIFLNGDFTWQEDRNTILFFIGVCVYQIYRLIQGIHKFFIKNVSQFEIN